jgi:tetratricopeptide (TPR) repeat protein
MNEPASDLLAAALAHHRGGNSAQAEQLYRQILAHDAINAAAWHLLGVLLLQTGRAAEAVDLIGRAIALEPTNSEYYSHLGAAFGALERHDDSVASLRRAVQTAPQSASAHYNLGTALRNAGQLESAVASFRHSIAADPASPEAHYNLANTLSELKRPSEAEVSFREALRQRPGYLKAIINLGNVLREQKQFGEALELLRSAVALAPDHANAAQNLGCTLRDSGQFGEAADWLRRAAALDPLSAPTQNNLGTTLQALAQFPDAMRCYDRALELDPELSDAHFSRATARLREGDLVGGFAEYEWRWKCSGFSDRGFGQPRWDGSPLEGRTILLYAEQGLGDTLHFVRYAADAQARGGRVIVECQAPLLRILAGCQGIDQLIPLASPLPPFDVHAPLLSLPGILQVSRESLRQQEAARGPYLAADRRIIGEWQARLARYQGFRVGICWQGNREYLFDRQRSFPLIELAPVARLAGVQLFSLQKGAGTEQIEAAGFDVIELDPPLDETAGAFMDTAAVIDQLDLVITSDTAIAHLAGALGKRVWVALSAHCDWRWLLTGDDTSWYPTMRLFRQRQLDQWGDVFERIAAELARLASGPRTHASTPVC